MIESICEDIYKLFKLNMSGTNRELFSKVYEIKEYFMKHPMDCHSLQCVFDLERKLIASRGPHKQFIEQHILETILMRVRFPMAGGEYYTDKQKSKHWKGKDCDLALFLMDFMREIIDLKVPRDNYNSKRRVLAFEIMSCLSQEHNETSTFSICQQFLKSGKSDLILAAIEFYESYCVNNATHLDQQVIDLLDKIILATKERSVAVSALNIQVETGNISELEALSRIGEWKDRNYYNR